MKYFIQTGIYSVILLLPILLVGCWDRREPENRAYVLATGFAYDDKKDLYQITVQIANPMAAQGEEGGGGTGSGAQTPVSVISAKGHTPFEAARNLTLYITREPFFAHNKIIVFSQSLAERGIGPVMDYLMREREMRLIAKPLVLVGDEITTLFRTEVPLEITPAEGLERQIALSSIERAIFPGRSLTEITTILPIPGREILIGRIMVHKPEDEDLIGENGSIRSVIHLGGGAVFKGDRMQGWFDERATRGWYIIQERLKRATINVLCPQHDEHPITLEIQNVQTELIPKVQDQDPTLKITVHVEGRIQNSTCMDIPIKEDLYLQSLNKRLAQVIENDLKIALERAKELKSDIFGLGNLFYRNLPGEWEKMEDNWPDLFAQLPVTIEVNAVIRRMGLISRPRIR